MDPVAEMTTADMTTAPQGGYLSEPSDTENRMDPVEDMTTTSDAGYLTVPLHTEIDIDTKIDIDQGTKVPQPSPLGAGFLILVTRGLTGLTQRELAARIGSSQPHLATLESGNRIPTVRTLLRVAGATGFDLVIGLRRPNRPRADPERIHALGFDLLGVLKHNKLDGLADFDVLREPSPLEGPENEPADPADVEEHP